MVDFAREPYREPKPVRERLSKICYGLTALVDVFCDFNSLAKEADEKGDVTMKYKAQRYCIDLIADVRSSEGDFERLREISVQYYRCLDSLRSYGKKDAKFYGVAI